jgi:hypothetical protein
MAFRALMIVSGFSYHPKVEVAEFSQFGVSPIILSSFLLRVRILLGFALNEGV